MIVTLTPNPSLDRALDVQRLVPGAVLRADAVHVHPGGKGINVSRALVRHGVESRAVLPVGGADGARLVELLAAQGVPALAVPVAGDTRTNITISERSGTTTKVNAPGPALTPAEVTALLDALAAALDEGARGLVAAGSLPAGAGDDLFVRVAALAAARSVPFALDTSGAPLTHAARAGGLDLLKPNDEELAQLTGSSEAELADPRAALAAVRTLHERGVGEVLLTLGADGALLSTADGGVWSARPPQITVRSTVGAGDCSLAGYVLAALAGADPAERLRNAVAYGAASAALPGSAVPTMAQVDGRAVRVTAGLPGTSPTVPAAGRDVR
jgi:1-phosphofructokinase